MSHWINEEAWLFEADLPQMAGQPGLPQNAAGAPPQQPQTPPAPQTDPNQDQTAPPQGEPPVPAQDFENDPTHPEMPEQDDGPSGFEEWQIEYVKLSIKGNTEELQDMLLKIRDKDLDPAQRKFVEDNLQICFLRSHQDVLNPSQDLRKLVKEQLDRNAPSTSLVTHIAEVLEKYPLLAHIYLKVSGSGGGKADLHRKLIAALMGAVQFGNGGSNEDLVFAEKDYSIEISTRFAMKWGDVQIGKWSLREDDPERYLKPAELHRLEGGSPEERDVLRRRVIMESIAETFRHRAFVINVVAQDGTVQHLGLDLGNLVKAAYLDGKLVCRTENSDSLDAFIDEEGGVIPIPHLSIHYVKDSQGAFEEEEYEELRFLEQRDGCLYLCAPVDLIKESSTVLQGIVYKESLFQGNPTDVLRISRCVPSSAELLLRQC
jgi:hypothetical protein